MNAKADRLRAQREADMEKGAADMWRTTVADTVIALLRADEPVTRDRLRQEIEAQITASDNRFDKARMLGALNVLNGRNPRA